MSDGTPRPKVNEHLANERTYLAWVRTSIALMGFGVVIARLRLIEMAVPAVGMSTPPTHSSWLGLAFAGVGLVALVFATVVYARNRRSIESDSYKPLGASLIAFSVIIFLLGIFAIANLLSVTGR